MRKFLTVSLCFIFLGLLVPAAGFAQLRTTGDGKLDSLLVSINQQAENDSKGFILQLSRTHNVPEAEIWQAKERHGLSYGDTYMATAFSGIFKKPVGFFAEEYGKNQGQGWGVMAKNMGIKPGSSEFMRMKANARGSLKHMRTSAKAKKRQQQQVMEKEREQGRKNKGKGKK